MKLGQISSKKLIEVLLKNGFKIKRIRGSHHFLENRGGLKTVVPMHSGRNIGPGLLNKIIKNDLGITLEEFKKWL